MPIIAPRHRSHTADTILTSGAISQTRDLARNPRKMSLALLLTAVAIAGFIALLVASAYAGEAATAVRVGALFWLAALGAIRGAVLWRRPQRR
jgi:hypothetical protein